MANTSLDESFQAPGDVIIKQLYLISSKGSVINLQDYLVELNIYENIYSSGLTGSIILSDSRNLIRDVPILGEELLLVEVKTPTLDKQSSIHKTFRIFSIKERKYGADGTAQIYKLNFCSVEIFRDISNPIFKSFSGKTDTIIANIYKEYLQTNRNVQIKDLSLSEEKTPLNFLDNTSNSIKFVSPGWTPTKCINWLASKSIPILPGSCNFLFWETTKGFYFGSTNSIFDARENVSIGNYVYSSSVAGNLDNKELNKRLVTIKSLEIEQNFDQMANNLNGYISNRLIDVNLYNKTFEHIDYDHSKEFFKYNHTEKNNSFPLFDLTTSKNPTVYRKVNYNYPYLFSSINENFSEKTKFIFGNRRATLLELENFRMKLTIPGRTDIEVGNLINITLPKSFPAFSEDVSANLKDDMYSGFYLITSINHKINPLTHYVTMNVTKDCIPKDAYYGK